MRIAIALIRLRSMLVAKIGVSYTKQKYLMRKKL
jgi:hypothetical protein